MREIRTHHWCDGCYDSDERYVEATDSPTLGVARAGSPAPRTLDLCAEHMGELLGPLRELLAEHGRKPAGPLTAAAKTKPTKSAGVPTEPTAKPEPTPTLFDPVEPRGRVGPRSWACPICGVVITRHNAIPHIYALHRPGETFVRTGPVCPDCGQTFGTNAGTAAHRVRTHGWDPLAEALAGAQR